MKTYLFKIHLFGSEHVNRTIEIVETDSLYKLVLVIIAVYNFDFDHCLDFYDNLKNERYHESKKQYKLFADLDNVEPTSARSIKRMKISEVWVKPGDKMIFLFDYGDGRRFMVELLGFGNKENGKKYPVVFGGKGVAPEQYGQDKYLETKSEFGGDERDFFESRVLVKTNAGSRNGKFRYWVVVSSIRGKTFASGNKKKLKNNFSSVAGEDRSAELEGVNFHVNYALCTVLISPKRVVGEVLDKIASYFATVSTPFWFFTTL